MQRVINGVRSSLGFRIYKKSTFQRWKEYFLEDESSKERLSREFNEKRRQSAGPAATMRRSHAFKMRSGVVTENENPLEPVYYRTLPKWLRAEGAYSPIEIGKIIMYLLIPIWAILLLGSRNMESVENLSHWFNDFRGISYRQTYEEQLSVWKRIDEDGILTLFGVVPVPGSTLERKLLEDTLKEDGDEYSTISKDSAPSTYFAVMSSLKKKQREDDKISHMIGIEAARILDESDLNILAPGENAQM